MPGIESSYDAHHMSVRLDQLYFVVCIGILTIGLVSCLQAVKLFLVTHKRLNFVLKSYASVLVPDLIICINFLARDMANLSNGSLEGGPWCKLSGFMAMSSITALHGSSVALSYCTYSMVKGRKLTMRALLISNCVAWVIALIMTASFALPFLGPYKGLYCCVTDQGHTALSVVPFVVFFFLCCCLMTYWYYQAFVLLQIKESALYLDQDGAIKASARLFNSSLTLLSVTYGCWFTIIVVGIATAMGKDVHPGWDMFGAWMAKLQPTIDSLLLKRMIFRALVGKNKTVASKSTKNTLPLDTPGVNRRAAAVVPEEPFLPFDDYTHQYIRSSPPIHGGRHSSGQSLKIGSPPSSPPSSLKLGDTLRDIPPPEPLTIKLRGKEGSEKRVRERDGNGSPTAANREIV